MNNLIRSYAGLGYRSIVLALRRLQRLCPPNLACKLQNIFVALHGSQNKYTYDEKKRLYIVNEAELFRYFGEMTRGFDFYARSIKKRGNLLAGSYCLEHVKFSSDDVVLDCGANYGDLYLYLRDKINEPNYIALEPGPTEYQCLLNSLPKARVLNLGLSNSDGEMDIYLCSESGDSSLVKPKSYSEVVKVSVKTLDSLADDLKITKCRLLKLEAEGWEPEILDGAKEFIKLCDYVAIDGGLERGVNEEATFPAINNFLMKNGFEMIDIQGPQYRALFQKVLY
jgi:FkbM family methyltransferase